MDLAGAFALGGLAGVVVAGGAALTVGLSRRTGRVPVTEPADRPDHSDEVPMAPTHSTDPGSADGHPSETPAPPATLVVGAANANGSTAGLAEASVAALHAGVLVLDSAGAVVLANPAAYQLGLVRALGPQPEAAGGGEPVGGDGARQGTGGAGDGTARAGVPAPGAGAVAHSVLRTLAGRVDRPGRQREVDLELRARDLPGRRGKDRFGVRVRLVGLPGGYVAMEAEDVTEAHRVARVRRDFVANVSHELKTPVGALQLLAEALVDALDDREAARRFAERIAHESSRLGRLVTELLELSRLQGAEPLPDPEPAAADRIINEVVDRTRTTAQAKDIAVAVTGEHGRTLYGNETQLVTALTNLVENAVAYSPAGTTVTIGVRRAADAILVSVADQGIGIEESDLDRIFERFYRADKARSRATGGTGLGLAIVKHIATNHGGRVEVTSTVGVGSTFTLRLPARPPNATAVEHNPGEIAEDIGTASVK